MKRRIFKSLFFIVGLSATIIWSCKDNFTEEDLLNKQAELNEQSQAHLDSMNMRRLQYTVTAFNASVSASTSGGRTDGATGVEGASVSITVDGAVQTKTTDANGMVVFENVPQGSVTGTVSLEGFTTVHYTANMTIPANTADPVSSAGTMVPIFETSGEHTATINGKVTYEGNLLNNTEESVPDGVPVSFAINTTNYHFTEAYIERWSNSNHLGEILSIAFEGDFTTTVLNGEYQIELPAAPQGLLYAISFGDFTADQTLAIDHYENDLSGTVRDKITVPTLFTQSKTNLTNKYTYIPDVNSLQADVEAPPASGSGATASVVLVATSCDAGNGFNVVASGSGYATNSITIPVTVSGGNYDNSIPGATPANIAAISNANGQIVGIMVTDAGYGYRSRPTLIIGGSGSGAVVISKYASPVAPPFGIDAESGTEITSGGTGYAVAPQLVFEGLNATGNLITLNTTSEILNGAVVDFAVPVTNFISTPKVSFLPIYRSQAKAAVSNSNNGEINQVDIIQAGAGYDILNPPSVTIRDLIGNTGSGAMVAIKIGANGIPTGYDLINYGSGYSPLRNANYPTTAIAFMIKTNLSNGNEGLPQNEVYLKSGLTRTINANYGTGTHERAVY